MALLCLGAHQAASGEGPGLITQGAYVVASDLDLVVARVLAVRDSGATVGDPPRVHLLVEQVVRGRLQNGPLTARWVASLETPFRCGNESVAEQKQWDAYYDRPLHGPAVGERLILAGRRLPGDSLWAPSEMVRDPYSSAGLNRIVAEVRDVERRQEDARRADRLESDRELAADRRVRAAADIAALCAASTDVLIGSLGRRDSEGRRRILAETHLAASPQDSASIGVDRWLEVESRRRGATEALILMPRDGPIVHRRVELAAPRPDDRPEPEASPPLLMFLRRGPFVPAGASGSRVYWLADHDNGLLPADSATIGEVRAALASAPLSGRTVPGAPAECGASLSSFVALPPQARARVRGKIICLKPGHYGDRAQSLLFGHGVQGSDGLAFPPCVLPGERYWHDCLAGAYPVDLSSPQMNAVIEALGGIRALGDDGSPGNAVASLQLLGPLGGTERACELLLSPGDLAEVAAALSAAVAGDRRAAWFLNFWKSGFGDPLQADPGFQLGGPH